MSVHDELWARRDPPTRSAVSFSGEIEEIKNIIDSGNKLFELKQKNKMIKVTKSEIKINVNGTELSLTEDEARTLVDEIEKAIGKNNTKQNPILPITPPIPQYPISREPWPFEPFPFPDGNKITCATNFIYQKRQHGK